MLTSPAKRLLLGLIRLGVSFVVLIIMLMHLAELLRVDVYVIALGVALFLLWFGESLLKRFNKVEGFGFKLDIRHVEELEHKVDSTRFRESEISERIEEPGPKEGEETSGDDTISDATGLRVDDFSEILQITRSNVALSLAALRIELERELIRLTGDDPRGSSHRGGVSRLTRALVSRNILTEFEGSLILELTTILNKAVHAQQIDVEAAERALDVGIDILHTLKRLRVRDTGRGD